MGAVREGDSVNKPARDSTGAAGSSVRSDKPSANSLRRHIQRFPHASVLVIGDLILDHYIWGRVSRISPRRRCPWFMSNRNPCGSAEPPMSLTIFWHWAAKRTSAASSARMKLDACC